VITIVVFGVSGLYALLTPTLRLTASALKTKFEMGESLHITVTLQNIGLWPLQFTHYPPPDFIVYNETGKAIFQHSNTIIRIPESWQWGLPATLWPTQTITETLTWKQLYRIREDLYIQVPKGTYTIVALTKITYINRNFLLTAQPITVTIL